MSEQATEVPAEVVEPEGEEDPLVALSRVEAEARGETPEAAETPAPEAPPAEETPAEEAERRYAGKFNGVPELERGYVNLEQEVGRMRNELGQTRQALDQYQNTYQPPQGQPQGQPGQDDWPQGLPQISQEDLETMMYEKPLEAVAYVSALMTQAAVADLRQELTGQLEPVYATVNKSAAAGTVSQLKEQFGDDIVLRNKEAIAAMIEADPEFYTDPDTRFARLRMTVQAAEYERSNGNRHGERAENGQYAPAGEVQRTAHMEGGSTAAPQPPRELTPDEDIVARMDAVRPQRDLFGERPVNARVVE